MLIIYVIINHQINYVNFKIIKILQSYLFAKNWHYTSMITTLMEQLNLQLVNNSVKNIYGSEISNLIVLLLYYFVIFYLWYF